MTIEQLRGIEEYLAASKIDTEGWDGPILRSVRQLIKLHGVVEQARLDIDATLEDIDEGWVRTKLAKVRNKLRSALKEGA